MSFAGKYFIFDVIVIRIILCVCVCVCVCVCLHACVCNLCVPLSETSCNSKH